MPIAPPHHLIARTTARSLRFAVVCSLLMLSLAWSGRAFALDVYFAGYAFVGDAAVIAKKYPYSNGLSPAGSSGPSVLDRALAAKVASLTNPSFTLVFDRLGKLGPDSRSSLALAFALDRETVSVEKIAGIEKILIELSAQALFFDFREQAVVASFPVVVQYIDVRSQRPTETEIAGLVKALYVGELGVNIFDEFATVLATAAVNPSVKRRVQVTEVVIAERTRAFLPPHLAADDRTLQASLAADFNKFLALNQRIPVLPYTKDYAIGNRMAARFADGSVYNLAIPSPDYVITLGLADLKKVEYARTSAGATFVYGTYLSIRATEPLSNTVYIDTTIKNGASKVVPVSQENVDDWAAFQDTLAALMDKLTRELNAPQRSWAEKYAGNPAVAADLVKLQKVLQSCR